MEESSWDILNKALNLDRYPDDPLVSMMKEEADSFVLPKNPSIIYLSNYWFSYLCRYCTTREQVVEYYFEALSVGSIDDFSALVNSVSFKKLVRFKVYVSIAKKSNKVEELVENESTKLNIMKNFSFLKNLPKKVLVYELEVPKSRKDLKNIGETLNICTGAVCHTKGIRAKKHFRITLYYQGKIKATLAFYTRNKTFYALEYKHKDVSLQRLERIHKELCKFVPEISEYKPMSYGQSRDYGK